MVPYFPERFGDACVSQLNDVVDNVLQQEPSMITIDDGIAALQVAVAATHALKENRIVCGR